MRDCNPDGVYNMFRQGDGNVLGSFSFPFCHTQVYKLVSGGSNDVSQASECLCCCRWRKSSSWCVKCDLAM